MLRSADLKRHHGEKLLLNILHRRSIRPRARFDMKFQTWRKLILDEPKRLAHDAFKSVAIVRFAILSGDSNAKLRARPFARAKFNDDSLTGPTLAISSKTTKFIAVAQACAIGKGEAQTVNECLP